MKWFKLSDFACKCGCGLNNISPILTQKIDDARELAKVPFVVNCGTRCPKHNKEEGGESNSSHLRGLAIDISVKTSTVRFAILHALITLGFKRIGVYPTFIHVDIDTSLPQSVIWYK